MRASPESTYTPRPCHPRAVPHCFVPSAPLTRRAVWQRGLDWDERFREDGSVSLPMMDRDKVPNMKNMAAIENVPFFDPAWIDPQPLLDWITGKSVPTGPAIPGLILGDSTHASVGLHLMQDTEG